MAFLETACNNQQTTNHNQQQTATTNNQQPTTTTNNQQQTATTNNKQPTTTTNKPPTTTYKPPTTTTCWNFEQIHSSNVVSCLIKTHENTRYVALIVELDSVSIKLSEYRVLCLRAIEQVGGPTGWRKPPKVRPNPE